MTKAVNIAVAADAAGPANANWYGGHAGHERMTATLQPGQNKSFNPLPQTGMWVDAADSKVTLKNSGTVDLTFTFNGSGDTVNPGESRDYILTANQVRIF